MRSTQMGWLALTTFALAPAPGCGPGDFTPTTTGKSLAVQGLSSTDDCPWCLLDEVTGLVLSHQTPSALATGVMAVELLRSPFDTEPHLLAEYDPPLHADLVEGASFVEVDTGTIPPGDYPFMRVTLAYTAFTVDAAAHLPGNAPRDGSLHVNYALSEYRDAELGARGQGDYSARFDDPEMDIPVDGNQPVNYPAPYPGASVDTSGGRYRVTFLSPQPVSVSHSLPEAVNVDVTFNIDDAFGWFDREATDNTAGVLDLSIDPLGAEVPASMLISGFSIAVSMPEKQE